MFFEERFWNLRHTYPLCNIIISFGDILSDEMAMIAGSLGMLASASLGQAKGDGLYFGIISLILLLSILSFVILRKTIFIKYSALLTFMFLWVAAGEGWLKSSFPQTQGLPFFTPNALGLLFFITFAYFNGLCGRCDYWHQLNGIQKPST